MRPRDFAIIASAGDDDIPLITCDALLGDRALLVLAPHPDDESLGCGAVLAQVFAQRGSGRKAHIICLTDGAASHPQSLAVPADRLAAIRQTELVAAVEQLGGNACDISFMGAPDGALAASRAIIDDVTAIARAIGAGLVLAPSPLDPHCDHVTAAEIGRRVAVSLQDIRLGFYPVWSRWHGGGVAPVPQGTQAVRMPPEKFATHKAAAIAAHVSQQGLVVPDAPDGFEMPPGFAAFFAQRDEIFFLDAPGADP